jgi:hypothetical protein
MPDRGGLADHAVCLNLLANNIAANPPIKPINQLLGSGMLAVSE